MDMNRKPNKLSLQLDVSDFIPAREDEKQSLVIMRDSVGFWRNGISRLAKNNLAMVS